MDAQHHFTDFKDAEGWLEFNCNSYLFFKDDDLQKHHPHASGTNCDQKWIQDLRLLRGGFQLGHDLAPSAQVGLAPPAVFRRFGGGGEPKGNMEGMEGALCF